MWAPCEKCARHQPCTVSDVLREQHGLDADPEENKHMDIEKGDEGRCVIIRVVRRRVVRVHEQRSGHCCTSVSGAFLASCCSYR